MKPIAENAIMTSAMYTGHANQNEGISVGIKTVGFAMIYMITATAPFARIAVKQTSEEPRAQLFSLNSPIPETNIHTPIGRPPTKE
jgi:hypothetical protein